MTQGPEALFDRYRDAIRRRDAEAIFADYVPDPVSYDLAPPLETRGAKVLDVAALRDWFDSWEDDLAVDHPEPTVIEDGDLAVVFGLQHMTGTKKGGEASDLWFRTTLAARRIEGAWKIVHIHTSVPFAMDGSGKALLDLKPEQP
jgi:ketosteroid isomerase-like protein